MKRLPDKYWAGNEDSACSIRCICGRKEELLVFEPVICPDCGRKYTTEFIVWQFEPGEEIPEDTNA